MKRIFLIDWCLIPIFVLLIVSGIMFHLAGHDEGFETACEVWHFWAAFHILSGSAFFLLVSFHIKMHWGWYKSLVSHRGSINLRKKIATGLLSLLFVAVSLSGTALLAIHGPNTIIGHVHYIIGILMTVLAVGHFLRRHTFLIQSMR